VKTQRTLLSIAAAMFFSTLRAGAPDAEETSSNLWPQALQEMAQVEVEIDRIEAQAIERLAAPPDNQIQQVELLGKLMLYDKDLSVNRNEACAFCHTPETGFTGPVSELNRTTAAYPGSVRTRFSNRKPQTHAYAPLAGWATRPPSRRKGRRPTRWKWACPISPARSIAPRRGLTAPCSKAYGARRPSRSHGRAT
jgi:cytochrome c peroxidase